MNGTCVKWVCGLMAGLAAVVTAAEPKPPLRAELLWTGSWEQDGNLINRGDVRLRGFGFTGRAQGVDKRPAGEDIGEGTTAFSGGLYHDATGSRILYGIQDEWGLPARIKNVWARSVPFAESHQPSVNDLKTEPSSREPASYLYLGSPRLGLFRGFASVLLDSSLVPAYGGGIDAQFDKKTNLRLEGFFTRRTLPPRRPSAWFSETPPLPERDFRISGANLTLTSSWIGFATDWAYSETFAYGSGLYGNAGLRLGNKPWRFSLAADGAGDRYVDRDGAAIGAGFRTAARLERRGGKSSLFRLSAVLKAEGFGEPFRRSSAAVYYRFPAAPSGGFPLRVSRVSLTVNRNGSDPAKILDSTEGVLGLNLGPVGSVFQGTLTGMTAAPGPFPNPGAGYDFNTLKVSQELSYGFKMFHFKAKAGYTVVTKKEPLWDLSFSAAARGKPGRLTVKLSSPDFPRKWLWTISWRGFLDTSGI